jgi:hypothetical protein
MVMFFHLDVVRVLVSKMLSENSGSKWSWAESKGTHTPHHQPPRPTIARESDWWMRARLSMMCWCQLEMASLRTSSTETGEEYAPCRPHSTEMRQPTEAVGTNIVGDPANTVTGSDGMVGLPSREWRIGCRGRSEGTHLDGFLAPPMADKVVRAPLRAFKEISCWRVFRATQCKKGLCFSFPGDHV